MTCFIKKLVRIISACAAGASCSIYALEPADTALGDRRIGAYFQGETRKLAEACLADVKTLDDWTSQRESYRAQLREMLGLDPQPERTPLEPVITGMVEHDDFIVEKLHFQSRPKLYVTANLYRPKKLAGRAPAILYLCGHSPAKNDGVSFGNKTKYQHHARWFASNGYVCLVLDTLQLGEIEGIHHGTYRENMWSWNSRGYTPAGLEAWNAIRALDYLESRPEVDSERIGVTGRSGGGAYTWWVAALDDRVKVAVPVAGITNLTNHVVDGCVEGHCDCMYFVNTYRWDYAQVAALVAPRPLLISNTDHDPIFPLDGVLDVYHKVHNLYKMHGQPANLGLHIAAGQHDDTQPLQVHAFQWFNRHLKGDDRPVDMLTDGEFGMEQLKVFDKLPADQLNSRIHDTFTSLAPSPMLPESATEWQASCERLRQMLREKCFAGWPRQSTEPAQAPNVRPVFEARAGSVLFSAYDFDSQNEVTLRLYLVRPADATTAELNSVVLHPLDGAGWSEFLATMQVAFAPQLAGESLPSPNAKQYARMVEKLSAEKRGLAYVAPRGIGPTAWDADADTHIRRRFMLVGQTLNGMRVWDTRRAIQALRKIDGLAGTRLTIDAERDMATIALYAALFEPGLGIEGLDLRDLSKSHQKGPDFLNVLRVLDVPQTVALAAQESRVRIHQPGNSGWEYPLAVAEKLVWKERITVHDTSSDRSD